MKMDGWMDGSPGAAKNVAGDLGPLFGYVKPYAKNLGISFAPSS